MYTSLQCSGYCFKLGQRRDITSTAQPTSRNKDGETSRDGTTFLRERPRKTEKAAIEREKPRKAANGHERARRRRLPMIEREKLQYSRKRK